MELMGEDEEVPVWIWYKDIDYSIVDSLTKSKTGISPEECSIIDSEFSKIDFKSVDTLEERKKEIKNYLNHTRIKREKENRLTQNYVKMHRKYSRMEYSRKAKNIISSNKISSNIIFESKYAPCIIACLNKARINDMEKNRDIESIKLYKKSKIETCTVNTVKSSSGLTKLDDKYGLTGNGVKVGMIDSGHPSSCSELDLSSIQMIGSYSPSGHAQNTARILVGTNSGLAQNIELISAVGDTNYCFTNVESLLTAGAEVVNVSWGIISYSEEDQTSTYAYTNEDKWFDHIVSQHNITVIASAGNSAQNRVLSPAMGHNIIAVGAYDDRDTTTKSDDRFSSSSSFKNSNGTSASTGVEKPDVVLSENILGKGTSSAAPVLTAMVAQILEMKPSLKMYPHVIKSIILASCHRKVLPSTNGEAAESIYSGITETQGAGAPDAWTMACIVCQGTYKYGNVGGNESVSYFEQPCYGATKMNISLTWMKNNHSDDPEHAPIGNVTTSVSPDLDMYVYKNSLLISTSSMQNSSTEMCYFNIDNSNTCYKVRITENNTISNARYAYAWSTNDAYDEPITENGIYYIRNTGNDRFIYYDTSNSSVKLSLVNPSSINSAYKWILKNNTIYPGFENLNGWLSSDNSYNAVINSTPYGINLIKNDDGSFCILEDNNEKALTRNGRALKWSTYDAQHKIGQKWYLEKVNYRVGDVNANGVLNSTDKSKLSSYLSGGTTLNNIQKYLADVNYDGFVNSTDYSVWQALFG